MQVSPLQSAQTLQIKKHHRLPLTLNTLFVYNKYVFSILRRQR